MPAYDCKTSKNTNKCLSHCIQWIDITTDIV